jgi:hypothetical protein
MKIDCRLCAWDGVPGASHDIKACYGCGQNNRNSMKTRKNKWELLCKYINRHRNGTVLTRQAILEHIHVAFYHSDASYKSVDTYRNYLTKAGFLCIIGPGKYEKVKTIPHKISRRDVQRLGYDVSTYYPGW